MRVQDRNSGSGKAGGSGIPTQTMMSVSIGAKQWPTEMLKGGERNVRRQRRQVAEKRVCRKGE